MIHEPKARLARLRVQKIFNDKTVNSKPVSAFETEDKCRHRFVSRSCLELIVSTLPLAATTALERASRCALQLLKQERFETCFMDCATWFCFDGILENRTKC